ncbi:hypothetical protein RclHR1_06310007 [Rhizophagus clarus]|uniref:GDP-fucose protein O-fucosyltransferase n=1 Tax=Rhizophagus clarus TaxID=94130 RepID=A0A2Z6RTJ2_9GLOM|nr:hypothetical protein RclHR1_06310007 [Rhizophagus clarus]GES82132.1 hypothetical protein GLOIN_2v1762689 [Rhizophagus clarus]
MSLIQITKKSFLIICSFFLLWYLTSTYYYEQELLSYKNEEKLTAVNLTYPSTLLPNTTPTSTPDESYTTSFNSLKELNKKFCGKPKCKFLFAYALREQETKANMHFRSFCQLAEKLDRIMVLTNVGSSRIGTCHNFPFDFYYNTKLIQEVFPKVQFKSENEFSYWLKERDLLKKKLNDDEDDEVIPPLSVFHSYIKLHRNTHNRSYYDDSEINYDFGCISKFEPSMNLEDPKNSKVKYTKYYIDESDLMSERRRIKFSESFSKTFTMNDDILFMNANVIHPLFPQEMPIIPYSEYILNEAKRIKNKLSSSYIAIHWRLEQSNPTLLPECAQGLIMTLKKVMKEEGIKNIYLATDYPLTSSKSQSDTFTSITNYHHEAIRAINETFKINTWVSLGGLKQLRENRLYNEELGGPGIQGILDKLVCVNANYFISGPEGCSRVVSTFTKVIVSERNERLKNRDHSLLNTIDRWQMPL